MSGGTPLKPHTISCPGTLSTGEPLGRDQSLPKLRLQVAEINGCTLGFIGMDGRHGAMLFVADEARSMGVGSRLLDWAKQQFPELSLAVNEQNPRAVVFCIRRDFFPVGRSDTDAIGFPYPLVQMQWEAGHGGTAL